MSQSPGRKVDATAFAPASVSNVAVGFDILGFSFPALGDRVTATVDDKITGVVIDHISDPKIPKEPAKNTAAVAAAKLLLDAKANFGLRLKIEKGIPLGSGLGGSAASAVAAVVAANALLPKPLAPFALMDYALAGEAVASGSIHADNVAPCLLGGFQLVLSNEPAKSVTLPFPKDLVCAAVHPHVIVETKAARGILKPEIKLKDYVKQSACLAGFISACYEGDVKRLGECLIDYLIEPQRQHLIPGFKQVKEAALDAGSIGCSISGSGPTVFALCAGMDRARTAGEKMKAAFAGAGLAAEVWLGAVTPEGARVV